MLKDFLAMPEPFAEPFAVSFRCSRRHPKWPLLVLKALLAAVLLLMSGCGQPHTPDEADMDNADTPGTEKEAAGGDDPAFPDKVDPVLVSIEVEMPPAKLAYARGEDFDPAGIVISGSYTDGSTRTEDPDALIFSGYDKTKSGDQVVTVSLEGKTAEFTVRVSLSDLGINITRRREGEISIPGIPPAGIRLSRSGADGLPRELTLRAEDYERVLCFVNGTELALAAEGFILRASDYSVNNHFITLIGIRGEVPYGWEFPFVVVD